MIRVENLHKSFGGVKALDGASIHFSRGRITGLIGANGAGKTTLFNTIAGNISPDSGHIWMEDEEITGLQPHELFHKGLLRTFQIAHEFSSLTVLDNLMVVPTHSGENIVNAIFRPAKMIAQEAQILQKAREVLQFLQIDHVADELAGNLSGGQKKLVELARTMMAEPKIIFLDEVGAGVNRTLLRTIGESIVRANKELGYTFCLIEHDMEFIARICESVTVMAEGRVIAEGTAAEVQSDERVIESYLGRGGKRRAGGT